MGRLIDIDLFPLIDNTFSFGEVGKTWAGIYVQKLYVYSQLIVSGTVGSNLTPTSDNSYDLGLDSLRWSMVRGVLGNFDSLGIGGTAVITSGRVLENVSIDAGLITSGVFSTSRIPVLDSSKMTGASGSFTTVDGKTVTVTNGIITSIA